MSDDVQTATSEPLCCGDPMVHNSATGEWECAEAYFTLVDEIPWMASAWLPTVADEDVPPEYVETLRHWRASRISDLAANDE